MRNPIGVERYLETYKRLEELASAHDLTETNMFLLILMAKKGIFTDKSYEHLSKVHEQSQIDGDVEGIYEETAGLKGISPRDLQKYSPWIKATTTAAVKRLYKPLGLAFQLEEYTCRRIRDTDARLREIILTSEGMEIYQKARQILE